jgi:hypothetical protein
MSKQLHFWINIKRGPFSGEWRKTFFSICEKTGSYAVTEGDNSSAAETNRPAKYAVFVGQLAGIRVAKPALQLEVQIP